LSFMLSESILSVILSEGILSVSFIFCLWINLFVT
jgi:hypothetical protein